MDRMELRVYRHSPEQPWTYARLDALQREIASRARAGGEGAVLLSEVAPVITMGRRAGEGELLVPHSLLKNRGIGVHPADRGGLATYHGPGQWVLFVVDRLERLTGDRRGVRRAVELLLGIGLEVARAYRPGTEIRSGCEIGVWTPAGKCAAVGIHVEDGVLLHGLAINGFRTPESFFGLRPCGLDAPVDFLLENPGDEAFQALGGRIAEAAAVRLGVDARAWSSYTLSDHIGA